MIETPRFLCIHQGYELYGSDRVFIQSLKAIRTKWPQAHITVHLPQAGPIVAEILSYTKNIHYGDLWVMRLAHFHPRYWRGILKIPRALYTAFQQSRAHDIVYINTVTVFSYILVSLVFRRPFILHAHELPSGWSAAFLNKILAFSPIRLVANSNATALAFPSVRNKRVVSNGIPDIRHFRNVSEEKQQEGALRLLLIGRINSWKGHHLALDALAILRADGRKVQMRFVGSVFEGQEHFRDALMERIVSEKWQSMVEMWTFDPNPDFHYQWADVVLVPSTDPEPFGLVAVEGMAHGLPVIAADHGGLSDIVIDGVCGRLFEPRNPQALAEAIAAYLDASDRLESHGRAARARFLDKFHEDRYLEGIIGVLGEDGTRDDG